MHFPVAVITDKPGASAVAEALDMYRDDNEDYLDDEVGENPYGEFDSYEVGGRFADSLMLLDGSTVSESAACLVVDAPDVDAVVYRGEWLWAEQLCGSRTVRVAGDAAVSGIDLDGAYISIVDCRQ